MFEVYVFLHEDDDVPYKIVSPFESEEQALAWAAAETGLVYEIVQNEK